MIILNGSFQHSQCWTEFFPLSLDRRILDIYVVVIKLISKNSSFTILKGENPLPCMLVIKPFSSSYTTCWPFHLVCRCLTKLFPFWALCYYELLSCFFFFFDWCAQLSALVSCDKTQTLSLFFIPQHSFLLMLFLEKIM